MRQNSQKRFARFAAAIAALCLPLAAHAGGGKLHVQQPAAYDKDAAVNEKVKDQCAPEARLSEFVKEYAKGPFDEVVGLKDLSKAGGGKTLSLTILNVMGVGGGAWSGPKGITVQGTLRENGKVIGTFQARRSSGGGAYGGFKGTCSILERCAKALGKDIAAWLEGPSMDARLGEMR